MVRVLILSLSFLFSFQAYSQSLAEIFEVAKNHAAVMKDKAVEVEIAQQKKRQATATVLPSVSATSSHTWREQVNVGAFGQGYQKTSYLTASQPLFQGGAEYYALKIAQQLPKVAQLQRRDQELTLYREVAEKFYNLILFNELQTVLQEQVDTLEKRVVTLKSRARIGRNKQTDVLAAETQLARARAALVQNQSQVIFAENALTNLTGITTFQPTDNQSVESVQVPSSWSTSVQETPAIRSTELLLENTRRQEKAVVGSFLPALDLDGNYYIERAGILEGSDWDLTLNATWELFSGGEDLAEKRIQNLEAKRLEYYLQEMKLNASNNLLSLSKEFEIKKQVVEKTKAAMDLAKRNYQTHVKEANTGLVSQLDVLQVLEGYLQLQQSFLQEKFNLKLLWVELKILAGESE